MEKGQSYLHDLACDWFSLIPSKTDWDLIVKKTHQLHKGLGSFDYSRRKLMYRNQALKKDMTNCFDSWFIAT